MRLFPSCSSIMLAHANHRYPCTRRRRWMSSESCREEILRKYPYPPDANWMVKLNHLIMLAESVEWVFPNAALEAAKAAASEYAAMLTEHAYRDGERAGRTARLVEMQLQWTQQHARAMAGLYLHEVLQAWQHAVTVQREQRIARAASRCPSWCTRSTSGWISLDEGGWTSARGAVVSRCSGWQQWCASCQEVQRHAWRQEHEQRAAAKAEAEAKRQRVSAWIDAETERLGAGNVDVD